MKKKPNARNKKHVAPEFCIILFRASKSFFIRFKIRNSFGTKERKCSEGRVNVEANSESGTHEAYVKEESV